MVRAMHGKGIYRVTVTLVGRQGSWVGKLGLCLMFFRNEWMNEWMNE